MVILGETLRWTRTHLGGGVVKKRLVTSFHGIRDKRWPDGCITFLSFFLICTRSVSVSRPLSKFRGLDSHLHGRWTNTEHFWGPGLHGV